MEDVQEDDDDSDACSRRMAAGVAELLRTSHGFNSRVYHIGPWFHIHDLANNYIGQIKQNNSQVMEKSI